MVQRAAWQRRLPLRSLGLLHLPSTFPDCILDSLVVLDCIFEISRPFPDCILDSLVVLESHTCCSFFGSRHSCIVARSGGPACCAMLRTMKKPRDKRKVTGERVCKLCIQNGAGEHVYIPPEDTADNHGFCTNVDCRRHSSRKPFLYGSTWASSSTATELPAPPPPPAWWYEARSCSLPAPPPPPPPPCLDPAAIPVPPTPPLPPTPPADSSEETRKEKKKRKQDKKAKKVQKTKKRSDTPKAKKEKVRKKAKVHQ